jgi:hypothetical protein
MSGIALFVVSATEVRRAVEVAAYSEHGARRDYSFVLGFEHVERLEGRGTR